MKQFLQQASQDLIWFTQEFVRFLRKKWLFVSLSMILCGTYLTYTFLRLEHYHQAEASFVFNYMHKKFYGDQIVKLNNWIQNSEVEVLQKRTGLNTEVLANLIHIEALNILKKPLQEDFTTTHLPFYIRVRVKNKKVLPKLEKGLLQFFNQHEFTEKKIERILQANRQKVSILDKDIALLHKLSNQDTVASFFKTADNLEKYFQLKTEKLQQREEAKTQLLQSNAVDLLATFSGTGISVMQQFLTKALKICFIFVALLSLYFLGFVVYQNSNHA